MDVNWFDLVSPSVPLCRKGCFKSRRQRQDLRVFSVRTIVRSYRNAPRHPKFASVKKQEKLGLGLQLGDKLGDRAISQSCGPN